MGEMISATYFDETGAVAKIMRTNDLDEAESFFELNSEPGLIWMVGEYPADQYRLVEGVPIELPPKPGPWAVWDGDAWIDPRNPDGIAAEAEAALVKARLAAVAEINAVAGVIRRQYVTDIPGQDALYLMKEAEARAWLSDPDPQLPDYPLIAAEAGITAPTPDQVAQVYVNLAAIYTQAAAQLETARLGHIAIAETAPTIEAAQGAADAFKALFD